MDKAARLKLKQFLEDEIPFYDLKKAGFFGKDIRKTDYEKIAARVCLFFGIKEVYEYRKIGNSVCGHLSMGNESDICGMEPGYGITIRPKVDMSCPTNWAKLPLPDQTELASQDKWLN